MIGEQGDAEEGETWAPPWGAPRGAPMSGNASGKKTLGFVPPKHPRTRGAYSGGEKGNKRDDLLWKWRRFPGTYCINCKATVSGSGLPYPLSLALIPLSFGRCPHMTKRVAGPSPDWPGGLHTHPGATSQNRVGDKKRHGRCQGLCLWRRRQTHVLTLECCGLLGPQRSPTPIPIAKFQEGERSALGWVVQIVDPAVGPMSLWSKV